MKLAWNPQTMSTGDDTIDRQHQELIKHLNILFDMMQRGEGGKAVKDVLAFLSHYAKTHFAHEENCMEAYRCPAAASNKAAHAEFLRVFGDVQRRFSEQGATTTLVLKTQKELSAWLTQHIVRTDTQLRSCVRKTA